MLVKCQPRVRPECSTQVASSLRLHHLPGEGSHCWVFSSRSNETPGRHPGWRNSWHLAGQETEFLWCVEHELHHVALGKLKMGLSNKDGRLPEPPMALYETESCTGYVVNKWHTSQLCHCELLPDGGFGVGLAKVVS